MTAPNPFQQTVMSLVKAFRTFVWLWVVPILAMTAAATIYAVTKSTTWQASQALVVRDEARGMGRQGRFDSTESMRASQETIIEVAKSRAVVSAALKQLGPPKLLASTATLAGPPAVWPATLMEETMNSFPVPLRSTNAPNRMNRMT